MQAPRDDACERKPAHRPQCADFPGLGSSVTSSSAAASGSSVTDSSTAGASGGVTDAPGSVKACAQIIQHITCTPRAHPPENLRSARACLLAHTGAGAAGAAALTVAVAAALWLAQGCANYSAGAGGRGCQRQRRCPPGTRRWVAAAAPARMHRMRNRHECPCNQYPRAVPAQSACRA